MILIKFHNLKEIQNYYQKQLSTGNVSALKDVKTKNGISFEQSIDDILVYEAERLRECVQVRIDEYYDSYTPKQYQRTDGLKNAFKAETKVANENGQKYIGLYFEDSLSWGRSVVDGSMSGFKPYLISEGWKDKSHSEPHFLGYAGSNFIQVGIDDWKSSLKNKNVEVRRIGAQGKFGMAERMGYTFE